MLYKSPATSTHFIYRICLIQGPLFLVRGVLWERRNPILENTENTKIVKRHSTQPKSYKKCLSFLESPKYLSISILKVLSSIWAVHCKCRNKNFHPSFFCQIEINLLLLIWGSLDVSAFSGRGLPPFNDCTLANIT